MSRFEISRFEMSRSELVVLLHAPLLPPPVFAKLRRRTSPPNAAAKLRQRRAGQKFANGPG
jgi:hypothetical protein